MRLKSIKTKIIISLVALFAVLFSASFVFAESTDYLKTAQNGLDTSASGNFATGDSAPTVEGRVSTIISLALSLLGVVFVVLMIYGGFLWMTARGDEGQVVKAKDLITAAVIGLVIVVSAYMITWFVVYNASFGTLSST